jgi:hypothetical protein
MKIISAQEARDKSLSYDKKLQDIGISINVAVNCNQNSITEEVMLTESDTIKLKTTLEQLGYIVTIKPSFDSNSLTKDITIKW